jgi:hypothetical protein
VGEGTRTTCLGWWAHLLTLFVSLVSSSGLKLLWNIGNSTFHKIKLLYIGNVLSHNQLCICVCVHIWA